MSANVSLSAESINVVRADGDLSAIKVQILKYFSKQLRSNAICKLSKCQLSATLAHYLWPSTDTRIRKTPDTIHQIPATRYHKPDISNSNSSQFYRMRIFLAHDAGDGDDKCKSWQFSLRHFYLFSVAVFFLPVHSSTNKVSFAALVFIVRRSSSGLGHWKSTFCTVHPLPNGWLPIAVSARKWMSIAHTPFTIWP